MMYENGNRFSGNVFSGNAFTGGMIAGSRKSGPEQAYLSKSAIAGETDRAELSNRTLQNLKAGDLFQGRILDIRNGIVRILLSDSQTISAKLLEDSEMNIDSDVIFQVKETGNGQIIIKPYGRQEVPFDLLLKALENASLKASDKNVEIVRKLIDNNLPIDRETLRSISGEINMYGEENGDAVIRLHKLNIPVTGSNIEQADNYIANGHRIARAVANISASLTEFLRGFEKIEESAAVNRKLLEILASSEDISEMPSIPKNPDRPAMSDMRTGLGRTGDVSYVTAGDNISGAGKGAQTAELQPGGSTGTVGTGIASTDAAGEGIKNAGIASTDAAGIGTAGAGSDNEAVLKGKIPGISIDADAAEMEIGTKERGISSENAPKGYAEGDVSAAVLRDKGTMSDMERQTEEYLKIFRDYIMNGKTGDAVKKLIDGKDYGSLVKKLIEKNFLLNVGELNGGEDLKEKLNIMYEKLSSQLSRLSALIAESGKHDSPAMKQIVSLSDNINFMSALNSGGGNAHAYIQIPLKTGDGNADGELYIYNKRKKNAAHGEAITAFLHFDLAHLKATDILLELNKNMLKIDFTLSDGKSRSLVEKHLFELKEMLDKRGYNSSLKIDIKKEDTVSSVFDEMLKEENNKNAVRRYSFDVRA